MSDPTNQSQAALQRDVARVVSRVILQTSGQIVEPGADERLFDKHVDAFELVRLVLALQDEFGVILSPDEATEQSLGSIAAITALLARRPVDRQRGS